MTDAFRTCQSGRFDHMATVTTPTDSLRSVLGWTAVIAAVWIGAAALRSETTLHLGPLIVPLLPAFLLRGQESAYAGVLGGTVIGAGVLVILVLSGNLDGPALEPFTSVIAESIVFLAAASAAGLAVAWISDR
ncbi:MAG: hypothetical protein ABFR53_04210 [Actinomycetota bacterium]